MATNQVAHARAMLDTGQLQPTNLFTSKAWIDVLESTYGFTVEVVVDEQTGNPFVFVPIQDIVGKRLVSLPFSDYTDFGIRADECERIVDSVLELYPGYSATVRMALADCVEPSEALVHRVRIQDEASMWGTLSKEFRWGVRKAERNQVVVVRCADEASMDRFFAMFAEHRRRKFGVLTPPRAFFRAIEREFFETNQGFILEAHAGSQIVSAALFLIYDGVLYYKAGASDLDAMVPCSNNLLLWDALRLALGAAMRTVDLGMSWNTPQDRGLVLFKEGLGGRASPISVVQKEAKNSEESSRPSARQWLRDMTSFLTSLPLTTSQLDQAGELWFRFFT